MKLYLADDLGMFLSQAAKLLREQESLV